MNRVFIPTCEDAEINIYELVSLSWDEIFSKVKSYTVLFDDKKTLEQFRSWCAARKLILFKSKTQRKRKRGEPLNENRRTYELRRALYLLKDEYIGKCKYYTCSCSD